MSGLKQHYIPQFLLRGFARAGSGKHAQVVIYSRTRGSFCTSTEGVGAQRAFYSHADATGQAETLDDRITEYESRPAAFVGSLRSAALGSTVDAREAAETVAHLSIRVAHVRDSFTAAMIDLLREAEELVLDPPTMAKLLKLTDPTPSKIVRDHLREFWAEHRTELRQQGLSRERFEYIALHHLRVGSKGGLKEQAPLIALFMDELRSRAGDAVRKGHLEALAKTLAPAPRIEALARLDWRVQTGPAAGCILPDCVAVAFLEGGSCLPLAFAQEDQIQAVAMPVSHDRLLVGTRDGHSGPALDSLSSEFAMASWDYFIARDDNLRLKSLTACIGERTRAFLANAVRDGTSDARKMTSSMGCP